MCTTADNYHDIINRSLLAGDTDKAEVFRDLLITHQATCEECNAPEPEPVVRWKQDIWYQVREK